MTILFSGNGAKLGGSRTVSNSSALVQADAGSLLIVDSDATTIGLTIQTDATVGWQSMTSISCYQASTAIPQFVAGAGVTLHNPFQVVSSQYSTMAVIRVAENEWTYYVNPLGFTPDSIVTAALNFGSISAQDSADLTIAAPAGVTLVEGAVTELGLPANVPAGIVYNSFVTAAGATVTVRATNVSASPINPASGTFIVRIKN